MTISIDTNQRPAMPIPFYQLLTQELLNTSPKDANAPYIFVIQTIHLNEVDFIL
jgi:hypothetical protein